MWKDVTQVKGPSSRAQSWEKSRHGEHWLQSSMALDALELSQSGSPPLPKPPPPPTPCNTFPQITEGQL